MRKFLNSIAGRVALCFGCRGGEVVCVPPSPVRESSPLFVDHFVGRKVLVVSNEDDSGVIHGVVDRVHWTGARGDIAIVVYKDAAGADFFCEGIVLPDTPQMRAFLDKAAEMFPGMKPRFRFLAEFLNFGRNLDYAAKQSR